jgi:hypothetical protein
MRIESFRRLAHSTIGTHLVLYMFETSMGIRGAKAAGDKRVSTLLTFSWSSLRASKLGGSRTDEHPDAGRGADDAKSSLHEERREPAN